MALSLLSSDQPDEHPQRIIMAVDYPLLERNDCVVRDRDVLGTDLGAALGDVAVPEAVTLLQLVDAIRGVNRMHLELRCMHEQAGADELFVQVMITENMTDILAQEALDALPELLNAIGVGLTEAPRPIGGIRRTRRELPDALLRTKVG